MRVVVATHGHCFDGLASAVVFTKLVRAQHPSAEFKYRGCGYGDRQLSPSDEVLSGDENAILDYRFFSSERLTWYFDHHRTAFATAADREFFEDRTSRRNFFFDDSYTSCTKLIEKVAQTRFGVSMNGLSELIRWADVIDSASFESAAQALDRSNPVMRLAAVVERHGDDGLLTRLVGDLTDKPLEVVSTSEYVTRRYAKLGEQHDRFVNRVRESAVRMGRVVYVDMTNEPLESVGKFVTYGLYPDAVYSVIVGLMKNGTKISVGYNPWSGKPRDVDISAICARYGGGGHAVVGAVQFTAEDAAKAREVARAIAQELAG
jgi:hypothetical protein